MDGLASVMQEIVAAKMKFIADRREQFLTAWVAEHGRLPSECRLVEETRPDGTFVTTVTFSG